MFEQGRTVFITFCVVLDDLLVGQNGPGIVAHLVVTFTLPEEGVGHEFVLLEGGHEFFPQGECLGVILGIEGVQCLLVQGLGGVVAGRDTGGGFGLEVLLVGLGCFGNQGGDSGLGGCLIEFGQVDPHLSGNGGHGIVHSAGCRVHFRKGGRGVLLVGFEHPELPGQAVDLAPGRSQLDTQVLYLHPEISLFGAHRLAGLGDFFLEVFTRLGELGFQGDDLFLEFLILPRLLLLLVGNLPLKGRDILF